MTERGSNTLKTIGTSLGTSIVSFVAFIWIFTDANAKIQEKAERAMEIATDAKQDVALLQRDVTYIKEAIVRIERHLDKDKT